MAITKIHSVTSTLNLAIDYITNPHKTEEQRLVECYDCSHIFAAYEFQMEQEEKGYHGKTQAFHIIQSFEPGETTPEQAHEIGKKLADELLKDQYKYVISTHVDKGHIHNHIILNSVNSVTEKSFSTEHGRKANPAWKQIREISDKLCAEYGLSVIQSPEKGKGKDHYEWEQDKAGSSWKTKLRTSIDECIKDADSFEDFLLKMQSRGYEVKHGKYIAFRAEGQERFTRAKTLGFYYQEENIRFRIDRRLMYRERENAPKVSENVRFVKMDEKVQASEGLRRWALLQNMQNASKLLNQLSERGIENEEDLKRRLLGLYDERIDVTDEIKSAEKEMTVLTENIRILRNYLDNREIDEQYRKSKNKDAFFREHESELMIFGSAKKAVKALVQDNGKLPNVAALEKRLGGLKNGKTELMKRYDTIRSEITELESIMKNIEKMERSGQKKEKRQSLQDELS